MAFIKRALDLLSSVIWCRILFDIGEAALRLLLIAVAFCASRGVRPFASCLQIPADDFRLEHISIRNCSFALLRLPKPCSGLSFSLSQIQSFFMASEDNRGKRAAEETLEENIPMNQCLRRMR